MNEELTKKTNKKQAKLPHENGMNRCPNCGSSDTKYNINTGLVNCAYCRTEFEAEKVNAKGGVNELWGDKFGDGSHDIIPGNDIILTFKCPACGAEVVIRTAEEYTARCHWCRHVFQVNEKIPNGAVPDMVLPFKIKKEAAEANIRKFVEERKFFAHPKFRQEFKASNVMGVFLPYMVVDIKATAKLTGVGEHEVRSYMVRHGKNNYRRYDIEIYNVSRKFDVLVDDLVIEASLDKLKMNLHGDTKNVINSIMPFDTENCVDWNPSYLDGFTSERRDVNPKDLVKAVRAQLGDVARYKARETIKHYDRGVRWDHELMNVQGTLWKTAYLPVWLYSYLQNDANGKVLHYVVVNARTGETMGSVPINKSKLSFVTFLIEFFSISIAVVLFSLIMKSEDGFKFGLALLAMSVVPGIIFNAAKKSKYRNMDARFVHEKETTSSIEKLETKDDLLEKKTGVTTNMMRDRNERQVYGVLSRNLNLVQERVHESLNVDKEAEAEAVKEARKAEEEAGWTPIEKKKQ